MVYEISIQTSREKKKRQLIEAHRFVSRILVGMPRDRFQEKAPKMREDQRLGVEA